MAPPDGITLVVNGMGLQLIPPPSVPTPGTKPVTPDQWSAFVSAVLDSLHTYLCPPAISNVGKAPLK